jgi:hypothetical protein
MLGSNVWTYDFRRMSHLLGHPIMGILGMDFLRQYCLQLDFPADKIRFLDPQHLNLAGLGKPFPLIFSNAGEGRPDAVRPFIYSSGLLGGDTNDMMIDIGDNSDGLVPASAIHGHYLRRSLSFLTVHLFNVPIRIPVKECNWKGNTYTNLGVVPFDDSNRLGLRFLARHIVTLDFPGQIMYLKQISVGPRKKVAAPPPSF